MERENWKIFHLKCLSLISTVSFLIVTLYLGVTFGNYYAFYQSQYAVKLEVYEIQRQYWSQYIYIFYLGTLVTCDLIALLAILYNLNYILLFDVFHHLSMLVIKVFCGIQLQIPGEHSLAVLALLCILHTVIIISTSLLYRKLDSVLGLKEILQKEHEAKQQLEKRRLKDRSHLNDKLLQEYEHKFLTNSSKRSGDYKGLDRRESNRSTQLEPLDIESNPLGAIESVQPPVRYNNLKTIPNNQLNNPNLRSKQLPKLPPNNQIDYDSDGYLKISTVNSRKQSRREENMNNLIKAHLKDNEEDKILDQLNRNSNFNRYARSYSVDDEEDIYFEPDACEDYGENHYDYLKCKIDDEYYDESYSRIIPKNPVVQSKKLVNSGDQTNSQPISSIRSKQIDKSVQTHQSNSSNETDVFYTADEHNFLNSNFKTSAAAIKETKGTKPNEPTRKVEYSTLKYDHKIFYESSV